MMDNSDSKSENKENKPIIIPRERPSVTYGITEKVRIGCGNLYITVNSDDEGICEVFTNTGRAGGCASQSEATSRVVSIALRAGVDAKALVEQLRGIRCPSTTRQKGLKVLSCPDAIGRTIERVINKEVKMKSNTIPIVDEVLVDVDNGSCSDCSTCSTKDSCNITNTTNSNNLCPECGKGVIHEGGCVVCKSCGFSKCG